MISRPSHDAPELSWWGWGDPALVPELSDTVLGLLRDGLGVRGGLGHPRSLDALAPPRGRLSDDDLAALAAVAGRDGVLTDNETRVRHLRGKSTPDLLRLRAGELSDAPDAVALPASHRQVLELLRVCSERRIAVVPFGGGTSVVGGLEADTAGFAGVIALDLRAMNALVEIDEESMLAVLEPGLRGPEADALLAPHGFTVGHFPQSYEYATLGGFAAARSSGQASAGYGRFDELVVALRVATPAGTLELGRAPRSAAGPDLRQLILGSEGALGVITALTIRLARIPEERAYDGWRFPSFADGTAALRRLAQRTGRPTVMRLSDETETALNLARPGDLGQDPPSGGCLAIVGYEGASDDVRARRAAGEAVVREHGGEPAPGAGEAWAADRYRGPYVRDAMLDAGALVDTLETATFWSRLPELYRAVSDALRESLTAQGTPPVILCHVSHVYETGASLYFTVGCAAAEDPVRQWMSAKAAAGEAILAAGATITHHHGVGRDHRPFYEREIGVLAVRALQAVKSELDPAGILNPGILLPRERR
jgi:alkyldihydroxyacetonephosphate synthase